MSVNFIEELNSSTVMCYDPCHHKCYHGNSLFTARNRSLRRFLFLQMSVHRRGVPGRYTPRTGTPLPGTSPGRYTLLGRYTPRQVHPLEKVHPPATVHSGIRSTGRRYASHWNAFLFLRNFIVLNLLVDFCWKERTSPLANLFSFYSIFSENLPNNRLAPNLQSLVYPSEKFWLHSCNDALILGEGIWVYRYSGVFR